MLTVNPTQEDRVFFTPTVILRRYANGWVGTLHFSPTRAVHIKRTTIESVLGSLLLDHATEMGIVVEEVAPTCAKCNRVFAGPSEYRFRGADGMPICRKPCCREVVSGA